jgi:hypothetical protein
LIQVSARNTGASRVDGSLRLLLKVKMFEDISSNNILVKTDACFTGRVQVAAIINTGLQIRLKLLA